MTRRKRPTPVELIDGIGVEIRGGKLYRDKGGELVEVDRTDPANKWIVAAWYNTHWAKEDGKYTVVGDHVNGNPYGLDDVFLERNGRIKINEPLKTDDDIREYFRTHPIYGIVFFKWDKRVKKIAYRTQYGFRWPPHGRDDNENRER